MKFSPKTKAQLRAGVVMTAFAAAVTLMANAPFSYPEAEKNAVEETAVKSMTVQPVQQLRP